MMTHTPGPIEIRRSSLAHDWLLIATIRGMDEVIGKTITNKKADAKANARLWAAAPDMAARIERLETATAAIAEIADHLKNIVAVGTRYHGQFEDIRWDVEKIAAIAQAEVT